MATLISNNDFTPQFQMISEIEYNPKIDGWTASNQKERYELGIYYSNR